MLSRSQGLVVAVLGVTLAVVLFVVLSGDDDDGEPVGGAAATQAGPGSGDGSVSPAGGRGPRREPKPSEPDAPAIEIRDGQPVGGVAEIEVARGDAIRVSVSSDADHEIHLHGYDVSQEVGAGDSVEFNVPADIEGVFELEIEDAAVPIAEISVTPG